MKKHLLLRKRVFPTCLLLNRRFMLLHLAIAAIFLLATPVAGFCHPIFNEPAAALNATDRRITGTVVSDTGEPLVGVSIKVQGANVGAVTDVSGSFSIEAPDDAVLVFTYTGFETQVVPVNGQSVLRVVLVPAVSQLGEVVVVGYGTQRKKDLTGSVSVLSSKDLENRASTQFGNAIEGKAAGVQVIRSSGQPQAGFSIRVRGTSSITSGSDPLYVVDGVPTYNTNEINPADIESISILKDASSAAVYGSSGANGVVLITTKRGHNQPLQLSFNTSATFSTAWKRMDVLNADQFRELVTEMGESTDWSKYNANTDWQDEIFRTAFTQNYQLSAAGGTRKTTYYLSGSYLGQNGIVLNNSLHRGTAKLNLDHQFSRYLKVGTALAYDKWTDRDVPENQRNGVIARLYTAMPNIGIRNPDKPGEYARSPFINDLENPVSTVYQPDHKFENSRIHGNVYAESEILTGLKLKSLFGYEQSNGLFTSFQDSVQTRYGQSLKGLAAENTYDYTYWITENTANYTTAFGRNNLALMGGFIASRQTNDNLYKSSHDFTGAPDNNVESGNVKATPYSDYARQSHVAFIGRANYVFADKYFLTSNFRADGSGQFSPKHRWGYFPSFSAGWRLSEEGFLKDVTDLNELKIRAGWGLVGNDRSRPYAWYGLVDTLQKYLIGGVEQPAFINTTLENSDLRWEKTSQIDIGIDIAAFNNRLTFTADYYVKKTTDLLLEVTQPHSTGFSTALQNAGSLENRGVEFQLSTRNFVREDFRWSTDFNISFNRGKVLDIVGTTLHTGEVNPAGTSLNTAIVQEGSPLGSFYGKYARGVDPYSGKIIFYKGSDGSDSVGIIGNANPDFVYGFGNSFGYKNFTLDFFFQGVYGNEILNATRILTESMVLPMNQSAAVLRRWRKPNDITDIPGVSPSDWSNSAVSTRYVENGSYLRLKTVTLGYSIPTENLKRLKISRFMVYCTVENLLTFTKYSGFDPEVSAFSASGQGATNQNTAPGVDFGTYPQSRDFTLGLNITF